jgi:ribose transport system permease protein
MDKMNNTIKRCIQNNIFMAIFLSIALLVIGNIISRGFAAWSNILNLLMIAFFLGVIALGQTVVMITDSGGIDLSIGSILQLAMILVAQICARNNFPFFLAVTITLLICFGFGILNGIGIAMLKIPSIIMTLSMSNVVIGVMLIYTKGFPTGMSPKGLSQTIYGKTLGLPNMIWIWFIIIVIALFILMKTKTGRIMYGVGMNRLTAELSGVNTRIVRILAYGVSGFICGLAGIFLLGYMSTPNNLETGSGYVMPTIAAAVLGGISLSGGKGSYGGAVMGVIFLTILEAMLMTIQMGEPVRKIIYGAVVIAVLISYSRHYV